MHDRARIFGEDAHLPQVRIGRLVAFEPIFISTLLLAHLAVPSQLLQTFGLDAVANSFGGEEVVLGHVLFLFAIVASGGWRAWSAFLSLRGARWSAVAGTPC